MDTTQVVSTLGLVFLTHVCLLMCHPAPWRTYQPLYLPGPQFCPDTGRTVCTAVDYYPTEQIYNLLTSARSQAFNLTSLFVDDRKGDVEPNLTQLPTQPLYYRDGYDAQPPSSGGGRYSSASYPSQQDRWRKVGQTPGPGMSRTPVVTSSRRQSRLLTNQRTSNNQGNPLRYGRNANNNVPLKQRNPTDGDGFGDYGYGVTQHNRIGYHGNNDGCGNPLHFRSSNFSRFPQDTQRSQEPYQIQAPYVQHNVKGHKSYPVMTARPQPNGNWKGSPASVDYSNRPSTPGFPRREQLNTRFSSGRRERRNEDIELACDVRQTYVQPRAALNDNSEWKYVVNIPERDTRFSQIIRVDICLNERQPCTSRISLPFGFESRCRQKFIKKRLLSLNPDGEGTSEENFFIPSCCVCEIVRIGEKK